ncbi:hypothetical protein H8S90_10655 [Olivibacter sp. SDN3]|uniref:hypothetical protein n=1 Tax=Olivibacter sp. SDN3 TaxID=2764720 RepID=UPI001650DEB4|nr:hypothetical protein [Olivibacter sp. SDN3]QNL51988.1 hypothetical protein H8S90_10655 [Olivibacter sp. SDN3]
MDDSNFDHILVFKTNINTKDDVKKVGATLGSQREIVQWNVDLYDVDRVLRIVSYDIKHQQIIDLLQGMGYACSELK